MNAPSPLLAWPGAVPAQGPDAGVAAHYGDPFREQRALDEGEGFVDLSHHPVVAITGPDRLSWLHSLTTQHLLELPAGRWTEALVLSPQGHVEHHLRLVDDGESTWAVVEPGTAQSLVTFLDSMRFLLRVQVRDATEEKAAAWRPGDGRALTLLDRAGLADWAGGAGRPAGVWAYEALRVAARRPRLGLDTDHRTLPNEVGWLARDDDPNAVHLSKGCYRGQEAVARVHNLGRPPRRLVFLHLDGSDDVLPAHGAAVEVDGRPGDSVGFLGTAARHHELGPIALALVKRAVPVDARLVVDGVAAAQQVVVSPEAGIRFDPRAALGGGGGRPRREH